MWSSESAAESTFPGSSEGFPGGSIVNNPPPDTEDSGSIPGSGRYLGEGNDNPPTYSCLESPMDRGAWLAKVHRVVKELDMT